MPLPRREFLKKTALASSAVLVGKQEILHAMHPLPFQIPEAFKILILATNWGFKGSIAEFCQKAKTSGYDGIEVWVPRKPGDQKALQWAVQENELELGLLAAGGSSNFNTHLKEFNESVRAAAAMDPLFINCHSGRDYFSFDQNSQLIQFTTNLSRETNVPIYHETHRGRICFAAHITRRFLEAYPEMRLTLDISHWTNVHESLLVDQAETIELALARSEHIHSRVGHQEAPQISDPRAPEWKEVVNAHFNWWDKVVERKAMTGGVLTMTTEFGPPNYMPALPYTRQPIVDLWEINSYMMELWRERYKL